MISITSIFIAEYAAVAPDGKVTIAGTFDKLTLSPVPGAAAEALAEELRRVPFPASYLVISSEASISGGLRRELIMRIVDGNGQRVADELTFHVDYAINAHGRPMRNTTIIKLHGLLLPGPDDYAIEIFEPGGQTPLRAHGFYVSTEDSP